jgi:hypothetical protein
VAVAARALFLTCENLFERTHLRKNTSWNRQLLDNSNSGAPTSPHHATLLSPSTGLRIPLPNVSSRPVVPSPSRANVGHEDFPYLDPSEHLVNDGGTIRCNISVDKEVVTCLHPSISRSESSTFRFMRTGATWSLAFTAELTRWDNATRKCIPIDYGISVWTFQTLQHFAYMDSLLVVNVQQ